MPSPDLAPSAARLALTAAVAAVDRELAANLELTTMFDQTRMAVVLEIGEFERHGPVLKHGLAAPVYELISRVYADVYGAESAMERRGPAGTIRDADRLLVETWEGDAREAQRQLRAALAPPPVATGVPATARHGAVDRLFGALRRLTGLGR